MQPRVEPLEDRQLLATFIVANLNDAGAGSLRQAIRNANVTPGADLINFSVAGTIRLTSGALPALTGKVDINGSTAPGFAGKPVVEVDFNLFAGLRFLDGSSGSALRSLALIRAIGTGVTIDGTGNMVIAGNFIGLRLDGVTAAGNSGDGVTLRNTHDNLIGHSNPVTGVTYNNADKVTLQPVTGWQGIRNSDTSGQYLISGTSGTQGLLFDGTIAGVGSSYAVNYPNAVATSVYGPDNRPGNNIRLVGTYRNADAATAPVTVNGFLFEGTTAELSQSANYRTINYPGAKFNYVHSTMDGLAVGNYDSPIDHGKFNLPLGPGHAFLYDIAQNKFLKDIVFPGSKSNTAYGIWHNGGTSYTICGGYSFDPVNNFDDQNRVIGHGYLVDYDSATGRFSHWTSFDHPGGINVLTHFEGISSVEKGVYTLSADSAQVGSANPAQGSLATVRRNSNGSFGPAVWVNLNYPGVDPTTHITSSNSVYGNQVVGVVLGANGFSYQATVNTGFQLSNVISGNGRNGITLFRANDNQIAMNYIGTDVTGTRDRGNAQNGILVTAFSRRNVIGGEATGGNNPTTGVIVRPPQGNLISGNKANGVFITGDATRNRLSGNFIGTGPSGKAALGNGLDGVAIENADGNQLIGCTVQEDPFVFYNVIGGNKGNGLRIRDANNTVVQANFFGLGADNILPVGNSLNGVVVEGSSANTTFGGVIPLGNVTAANGQNGVVVRDTARDFVAFNTFAGMAAFTDNPFLGNARDGFLITSTGGNQLIRTSVISRNGDDGIEISGAARGVQVVQNLIGTNTPGRQAMKNGDNGVEIGGNAHDIVIGGPQPTFSVAPHNVISGNGGNGVAIRDNAHDIQVNFSYIGTDTRGEGAIANERDGVFLGPGTHSITIGSRIPRFLTVISGNLGDGIEMRGSNGNAVIGSRIGTAADGLLPIPNSGHGVHIINSFENVIGGTRRGQGNVIAFNGGNGVFIASGNRNGIRQNSIHSNALLGIDLGPGANNNQAAPVLTSVVTLPGGIRVSGTLTSTPNTWFTIELFANVVADPSGSGEGRIYLGSVRVRTNAAGFATFTFAGLRPPSGARFFSATATDLNNNTSEFSLDKELLG